MSRNNIHEVPETRATFERQLDNGVQLKYQMSVLQQPERARACGMGAKSHADRRPVDPPPVVELRLFHVTADGGETDVTFQHNSNFFLYASLELARPVAHARGMPAPPPSPVLTGVPVSGMAYLDRPAPAGYFIFPDLSVRHEGRYRLRFALYEDTKEQQATNDPHEPREYCVHRLDVKSRPFTVFSAKKFPGLAESTSLSRIVAEQGCRVRIRRDVRMRRRNDRPRGRESEDSLDETAMLRAQRGRSEDYDMDERMSQPPSHLPTQYRQPPPPPPPYSMHQQEAERKRSVSDAPSQPTSEAPRYNGQYIPPAPPSHGNYGHPAPPPTPAPAPQHSNNHAGYAPNSHSIPPPAPAAPQYQAPPPPAQNYMNEHSRPQTQYHAPPPPPPPAHPTYSKDSLSVPAQPQRRESVGDYSSRRESDASYQQYRPSTPGIPQPYNYPAQAPQQQQQQYPYTAPTSSLPPMVRLPPISDTVPVPPPSWSQPPTPSTAAPPRHRPPPPPINPSSIPAPNPSQFPSYYPEQKFNAPTTPAPIVETSKKRQWGRVFNTAHTEGALRGGMRPDTESDLYGSEPYAYVAPDNDDDGYDIGKLKMSYRRADGIEVIRRLHGDV